MEAKVASIVAVAGKVCGKGEGERERGENKGENRSMIVWGWKGPGPKDRGKSKVKCYHSRMFMALTLSMVGLVLAPAFGGRNRGGHVKTEDVSPNPPLPPPHSHM